MPRPITQIYFILVDFDSIIATDHKRGFSKGSAEKHMKILVDLFPDSTFSVVEARPFLDCCLHGVALQ